MNTINDNWCGPRIVSIDDCYIDYRAIINMDKQREGVECFDILYKEYLKGLGIKDFSDLQAFLKVVPHLLVDFLYDFKNKRIIQMKKLKTGLTKDEIISLVNNPPSYCNLTDEDKEYFEDLLEEDFWKSNNGFDFNIETIREISDHTYMNFNKYRYIFIDYILNKDEFSYEGLYKVEFDEFDVAVRYRPVDEDAEEISLLPSGRFINADDNGEYCLLLDVEFTKIEEYEWNEYY